MQYSLLEQSEYKNRLFHFFEIYDKQVDDYEEIELFIRHKLSQLPLSILLKYLRETHYTYLHKTLPEMEQNFHHLLRHHNNSLSVPVLLCNLFMHYKQNLTKHIQQEEIQLFPYIEQLIHIKREVDDGVFSNYFELSRLLHQYSIQQFNHQYADVENKLTKIREVIMQFSPVNNSPFPFSLFLVQLEQFEMSLNIHAKIEDVVFAPKVEVIENQLRELVDTDHRNSN